MTKTYRMIVITDHRTHGRGESIYPLLRTMQENGVCKAIHVASRGDSVNDPFFYAHNSCIVYGIEVDNHFNYDDYTNHHHSHLIEINIQDYDVLFLRIDRPATREFLDFLVENVGENRIINRPSGIAKTGSKEFLLNFPQLCPVMKLCRSIDEILDLYRRFPVILKPLTGYGGKGIIRLLNETASLGDKTYPLNDFLSELEKEFSEGMLYLGMEYLRNVHQGDKRVIVVGEEGMGATLRKPKDGSWLCNLSMGGTAEFAEIDDDEMQILKTISPPIVKEGVLIFGFDTLVNNEGRRVLSEINTLNVGGLLQAEKYSGQPVLKRTSDLIWKYIQDTID